MNDYFQSKATVEEAAEYLRILKERKRQRGVLVKAMTALKHKIASCDESILRLDAGMAQKVTGCDHDERVRDMRNRYESVYDTPDGCFQISFIPNSGHGKGIHITQVHRAPGVDS